MPTPEYPGTDLAVYLSRLTWATTRLAELSGERLLDSYNYTFQVERAAQKDVIKAREKRIDVIQAMLNMVPLPDGESGDAMLRELGSVFGEINPTPAHLEPDGTAASE
jgi:hypothetical protein